MERLHLLHGNSYERPYIYITSTCVDNFMLPPSIHFEISFLPDAYNFGTLGAPLTPWCDAQNLFIFFLVDYRYTYLDINCQRYLNNKKKCV